MTSAHKPTAHHPVREHLHSNGRFQLFDLSLGTASQCSQRYRTRFAWRNSPRIDLTNARMRFFLDVSLAVVKKLAILFSPKQHPHFWSVRLTTDTRRNEPCTVPEFTQAHLLETTLFAAFFRNAVCDLFQTIHIVSENVQNSQPVT